MIQQSMNFVPLNLEGYQQWDDVIDIRPADDETSKRGHTVKITPAAAGWSRDNLPAFEIPNASPLKRMRALSQNYTIDLGNAFWKTEQ
jgi:hypothetical protein